MELVDSEIKSILRPLHIYAHRKNWFVIGC